MKTGINLFEGIKPGSNKPKSNLLLIFSIVFVAAAALMTYFYLSLLGQYNAYQARIDGYTNFLNSEETIAATVEYDQLLAEQAFMAAHQESVGGAVDAIQRQPSFTSNIYNMIVDCKPGHVSVEGVSYNDGTVMVTCVSTINVPPADYAQRLDNLGIFEPVQYSGFSQSGEGYVFTVVGKLLPPVIQTEEEAD